MPLPGLMAMPRSSIEQAGPTVRIDPDSVVDTHSGSPNYAQEAFVAGSTFAAPSSYVWSIISGVGSIISGQGTNTAIIRTTSACVIRCAMDIGGITYSPEASMLYAPGGGGGELF